MVFRTAPVLTTTVACFTLAMAFSTARADVTVVSTETTTGTLPGQRRGTDPAAAAKPTTSTTTVQFQGHKVRIENEKTVIIFDGDSKIRYIINPAEKTYWIGDLHQGEMPGLAKMLDIKTTVAVSPTGRTRLLLGQNAREYDFSENTTLSIKPGAMAQPGATPNPAVAKAAPVPIESIKVKGQQWVGAVPGLPADSGEMLEGSSGLAELSQALPGLKALSDALKGVKGYALASHQSVTMTGMGIAAAMGQANGHFAVDTTTTAIRQDNLPKSLFAVPTGYKQIDPPTKFLKGAGAKRPAMPF